MSIQMTYSAEIQLYDIFPTLTLYGKTVFSHTVKYFIYYVH